MQRSFTITFGLPAILRLAYDFQSHVCVMKAPIFRGAFR